jgi:hypothetical protein
VDASGECPDGAISTPLGQAEGKQLGRPRLAPELEQRIREALRVPGRTEGVRKIAARFGVSPDTVQRISRPFDMADASPAA